MFIEKCSWISTSRRNGKRSEQKWTVGEIKLEWSFSGHLSIALESSLFTLGHKITVTSKT